MRDYSPKYREKVEKKEAEGDGMLLLLGMIVILVFVLSGLN